MKNIHGPINRGKVSSQRLDYKRQVAGLQDPFTFPEVHCLKDVSGCHSISFCCLQELRDLLHLFKGHLGLWNLFDWFLPPWIKAIDESTQDLGQKRLEICLDHILQNTTDLDAILDILVYQMS